MEQHRHHPTWTEVKLADLYRKAEQATSRKEAVSLINAAERLRNQKHPPPPDYTEQLFDL